MNIDKTLAERAKTHGEFADHATTSQELKDVMRGAMGWDKLSYTQREALDMIQHKVSRILNGDPNFLDTYRDIIGYAELVRVRLAATDGTTDTQSRRIVLKDGEWELA